MSPTLARSVRIRQALPSPSLRQPFIKVPMGKPLRSLGRAFRIQQDFRLRAWFVRRLALDHERRTESGPTGATFSNIFDLIRGPTGAWTPTADLSCAALARANRV